MKTILAATDFSPSSLNACRYAAMLSNKFKCKLTILNMFEIPVVHSNSGLFFMSFQNTKKNHGDKLQKLERDLKTLYPKIIIESILSSGSLKETIVEFINTHHIKAVVMGLGAKTKINRYLFGSNAVDIAGKIDSPVIIVPEKYNSHHLNAILLGVDNNEKLYHAKIESFENFLKASRARLKLIHVRTKEEIFQPQQLEIIVNHKKYKIVNIHASTVQSGIVGHANNFSFDLITIVSKKHSAFYEMFSETNTKQIAFNSNLPVMAIHE